MTNWGRERVVDLRAELRSRGLQHSGLKQELVQRLQDDDARKESNEETEEHTRGPSLTTHTTDDDGIVAFHQEVQAVTGIKQVAESTAQPSPLDTREEDLDQAQKRKRRSTTPPPDPKRCKTNVLSPPFGSVSSSHGHNVNEVLSTEPTTNTPDASAPDSHLQGNYPGDPEDGDPATAGSTPVHASGTNSHSELSGMAGGISSPHHTPTTDPALYTATRALYIRELMRPLREDALQAYLVHVSAATQEDGDSVGSIELFHINRIKTHAFVVFSDTSMAIRVRSALHNMVWPQECTRKPLWVDFVPVEMARVWAAEEKERESAAKHGDTAQRWMVRYRRDAAGNMQVTFGEVHEPSRLETGSHPRAWFTNQRFTPAQVSDNANAVPLGPRKPRGVPSGPATFPGGSETGRLPYPVPEDNNGRLKATQSKPAISYQKVATGLASRRIRAIRSHYTHDIDRKLGDDDEINRYSFESEDIFMDRGKENFVGIRPPHRDARRYVLRDGVHRPYRRRNSPPRHMAKQPLGSGPADGRYPLDTVGDMPRRRFGRDPVLGGFGTGANHTPIGHSHRFRQRD